MRHLRFTLAACAALAGSSWAATVNVITSGDSFLPQNISVNVGDTVVWTWTGFHSITSGNGGAPDGFFTSGAPTTGGTFQMTFDQAFLTANPVAGNLYNYFCDVHISFGMEGSVRIDVPAAAALYGCGINPAGSLAIGAGTPKLGSTFTMAVHNPLGTQAPGSLAFLATSAAAAPGFPCGIPLGGFGMSASGAVGELLVNTTPGLLLPLKGPVVWPGTPAGFNIFVPNNTALMGAHFYFQGAIVDLFGAVGIGLTVAQDCTLGI